MEVTVKQVLPVVIAFISDILSGLVVAWATVALGQHDSDQAQWKHWA